MHRLLPAVLMALLALAPARARAGGARAVAADSIRGTVTDSTGAPLRGVGVLLVELSRRTETAADGGYTFADVPPGRFTLVFRLVGFAAQSRPLVARGTATLDVRLRPSPVQLDAVTVTATRTAADPLSSPLATATLGSAALDRSYGVSLAHALEALSGVRALTTGGEIGKPVIRGLSGARVLVLDDGRRLEDYSWSDEDGPSVEPRLADRVEVIRGPASVLYGSDALGGVVNVIPTDVPDARTGHGVFKNHTELYGASNNGELGAALHLEGSAGGLGWLAGVVGRRSEALHTPAGELENTGFAALSGEAALGSQGPWGKATLRFTHYGGEFHLLEADTSQLPPPPPPTGGAEEGPVRKLADERLQLGGTFPFGGVRLEAKGQWQRHWLAETVEGDTASGELGFDLLLNTTSLDLLAHHGGGSPVTGTVGASGFVQSNATRGDEPLVPAAHAAGGAVFAFEQATLGRWSVLAGARVDARRLDTDSNSTLGRGEERRRYTAWSGDAGIVFRPADGVGFAANVGRAWRSPTLFELFTDGPHPGEARFEIGQPDLEPEASFNLDVSARLQRGGVGAEVAAFRNRVNRYVYITPTGTVQESLPVYRYQQADALLWGGEASLEVAVGARVSLHARADLVHGERVSDGQPLPQIPPFFAKVGGEWHGAVFAAGIDVDVAARQTHLSPFDFPTAGYTLLDLFATLEHHLGAHPMHFELQVRNVIDTSYKDFLSRYKAFALNPGRNVVLRLATEL